MLVLHRIGVALLCALAGYVAGAFGGGWLINTFSHNTHDRSTEAAMTGAFVIGPLIAVLAFLIALALVGRDGQG